MEACSDAHHWAREFVCFVPVKTLEQQGQLAVHRARQLSAWLGLVPGQYSSGGKARLGHITKAGDPYLRSLLVLGARAVLQLAKNKADPVSRWVNALAERRGYWRAVVAIAAKNVRMCWAVLNRGEAFRLPA